jgi:hypothetical protein
MHALLARATIDIQAKRNRVAECCIGTDRVGELLVEHFKVVDRKDAQAQVV